MAVSFTVSKNGILLNTNEKASRIISHNRSLSDYLIAICDKIDMFRNDGRFCCHVCHCMNICSNASSILLATTLLVLMMMVTCRIDCLCACVSVTSIYATTMATTKMHRFIHCVCVFGLSVRNTYTQTHYQFD